MSNKEWSSLFVARSGVVELAVDESVNIPKTNCITLTLPDVELRFSVLHVGDLRNLCDFISRQYNKTNFAELEIGIFHGLPVILKKCNEHADRFYIGINSSDGMLSIEIVNPITIDFVRAAEELSAFLCNQ